MNGGELKMSFEKKHIEKVAAKKLNPMASGAILGAGIAASSAFDKSKERGLDPSESAARTLDGVFTGAAVGTLTGGVADVAGQGVKKLSSSIGSKAGGAISKLKKLASEEEKCAKYMTTVGVPTFFNATIAGEKAREAAQNNPYLNGEEDVNRYVNGKKLQSAAATAALLTPARALGKATVKLFKKAEMKVPDEKEFPVEDLPEEESIVRDSPNNKEIKELAEPINDKTLKRNKYKYLIEKLALESVDGYLKPIKCDNCGYSGLPKSNTGACPDCGALGGKVSYPSVAVQPFDLDSKERNLTSVWDMAEQARQERLSYYR